VKDGDVIGKLVFNAFDGKEMKQTACIESSVQVNVRHLGGILSFMVQGPDGQKSEPSFVLHHDRAEVQVPLHIHNALIVDSVVIKQGHIHAEMVSVSRVQTDVLVAEGEVTTGNLLVKKGGVRVEEGNVAVRLGDLTVGGSADIAGSFAVGGPVSAAGNVSFDESLVVKGSGTFQDQISAGEGIRVLSQGIEVLHGGCNITGTFSVHVPLNPIPIFTIHPSEGYMGMDGDLFVNGKTTIVSGKLHLIGSNLVVETRDGFGGDAAFQGTLTVGGHIQSGSQVMINDNTDSTSLETGSLVTLGGIAVEKSISIGDKLQFISPESGDVSGSLYLEDDSGLNFDASVTFLSSVTAKDVVRIGSRDNEKLVLSVNGISQFTGHMNLSDGLAASFIKTQGAIDCEFINSTSGDFKILNVGDSALFSSFTADVLSVVASSTFSGSTSFSGDLELSSDLKFHSFTPLTFFANETFSSISQDSIRFSPPTFFRGPVTMHNSSTFEGEMKTESINIGGFLITGKNATLNLGNTMSLRPDLLRISLDSETFDISSKSGLLEILSSTGASISTNGTLLLSSLNGGAFSSVALSPFEFLFRTSNGTISRLSSEGIATPYLSTETICSGLKCIHFNNGSITFGSHLVVEDSRVRIETDLVVNGIFRARHGILQNVFRIDVSASKSIVDLSSVGSLAVFENCLNNDPSILKLVCNTDCTGLTITLKNKCTGTIILVQDDIQFHQVPIGSLTQLVFVDEKWSSLTSLFDVDTISGINIDIGTTGSFHVTGVTGNRLASFSENGTLGAAESLTLFENGTLDLGPHVLIDRCETRKIESEHIVTTVSISELDHIQNPQPISNALEKVCKLKGVMYKHENVDRFGIQRDLIDEVLPQVSSATDLSVQYTRIVPLLVESIKEMKNLISSLQARIDQLEGECKA